MNRTKIEWTDFSWNPVWGCYGTCEYCYSRKIAKRFCFEMGLKEKHLLCSADKLADKLYYFEPTWLESNFNREFPNKPSRIFVDSMSDVCWWKSSWIYRVVSLIEEYPQHTFIFLTKRPDLLMKYRWFDLPNIWLGVSISTQADADLKIPQLLQIPAGKHFVSIEPIFEKVNLLKYHTHIGDSDEIVSLIDWIIVGLETGNRKDKVIPDFDDILYLRNQCVLTNTPIFLKDNLKPIWGEKLIQEFPE